jgi:pimeloyl-ACP methyl ester carboxylesterase
MIFEKKTVALDKGEVTYFVGGEGSPVLYLHGAGGLLKSKAHELLSANHKIYMPITPGYDGTEFLDGVDSMPSLADLTADFVNSEIGGSVDVIGHSFGGWHACWLAVNNPQLVELLVLEAPAGFRPGGKGGLDLPQDELMKLLVAHPEKRPKDDRPLEMIRGNRDSVRLHYHGGMPLDEALLTRLGEIKSSTLLVYGTLERIVSIETCRILKEAVPRIYFNYIYDAAHTIEVDQPERFVGIVGDFLERGEAFLVNNKGSESAA